MNHIPHLKWLIRKLEKERKDIDDTIQEYTQWIEELEEEKEE